MVEDADRTVHTLVGCEVCDRLGKRAQLISHHPDEEILITKRDLRSTGSDTLRTADEPYQMRRSPEVTYVGHTRGVGGYYPARIE